MRIKVLLSQICLLFPFLVLFPCIEAAGGTTKVLDNGDPSERIDLVVIGSGYTSEEMDSYKASVNGNINKMLSVNWFSTNQNLLNVWRVDAESAQSGIDLDDATIYNLCAEIPYDIIIVIHNKFGQESVQKPYIELYRDSHNYVVMAHELGHKIGALDDEYFTPAMAYKCDGLSKRTLNVHDSPNNEKWADLISTAPVEGARYCKNSLWRPSENSIMKDSANTNYFNAVGMKAMDLGAGKIIGTIESAGPALRVSGVSTGETKSGVFSAEAVTSDASGIERVEFYWARAGETSKSVKLDTSPPYDLSIDTRQFEDGQYYLDVLSYDKNWNYSRKTTLFNISNSTQKPQFNLNVPLNIKETAGIARIQEPISSGVPFPTGIVKDISKLAVYNKSGSAIPAQFKVLERWNGYGQDNSIKWILVTFLADASASRSSTYYLRFGNNPIHSSPASLQDDGNAFILNGQRIMKDFSTPFKLALTSADGQTVYNASDLSTIQWTVEEAGPIRICLKAESVTEPDKFGFIAWIYGFAGQSRLDMTVVLKNTPKSGRGPFYFKDFSVSWENSGSTYAIGGDSGQVYSGTLSQGEQVSIYQDSSGTDRWNLLGEAADGRASFVTNWTDQWKQGIPLFRGFRLFENGQIIGNGDHAPGWASSGKNHVLVRHFWQNNPIALEVTSTRISAKLLPEYWTGHGGIHWLDDLQRKAYDISFRVGGTPQTDMEAFNSPLVIHCGLEWYKSSNAIGYISNRYKKSDPNPDNQGAWEYNWVHYGGYHLDRIRRRIHWFPMDYFVRKSDPYNAQKVWLAMRHSSGITPLWVDNYTYPGDSGVLKPYSYTNPVRDKGIYSQDSGHHSYMPWNPEHFSVREIFDGYRLFGDPLAFDALEKIGAYIQFYIDYRATHDPGETRWDALPMSVLCDVYRLTENESVLNSIKKYLGIMWNTINKDRGYYAPNSSGNEKPFMIARLTDALVDAYSITGDERAFDMIIMLTDYVINEGYANNCVLYEIPIDPAARDQKLLQAGSSSPGRCNSGSTNVQQMTRPLAWCFLKTKDPKYLNTLNEIVEGAKISKYYSAMMGYQAWLDWGSLPDYVYEVGGINPPSPTGLLISK